MAPLLSFVIPTFNEARHLPRVLAAIEEQTAPALRHETIIVDNGSTDATRTIARAAGACLLEIHGGTVAALRNAGARAARGELLVFIDGDVVLGAGWGAQLPRVCAALRREPATVTGSWVRAPEGANWLQRHWFGGFAAVGSRHINSGHMILKRTLFKRLGGFDERLETGEDYDLSVRALALGGRLVDDPQLPAIHLGFPKTLAALFRREMWHGTGDFDSWRHFRRSRVALAAVAFLVLHVTLVAALVAGQPWLAAGAGLGVAGGCLASAAVSFHELPWTTRLLNSGIYYIYFAGRIAALGARLFGAADGRRHRPRTVASTD